MTTHQIELPEMAESFVDEQVASGRFTSPSEFIVNLIEQARLHAAHKRVERLLLEGLESGPGIEVTPDWWRQKAEEWSRKYEAETTP